MDVMFGSVQVMSEPEKVQFEVSDLLSLDPPGSLQASPEPPTINLLDDIESSPTIQATALANSTLDADKFLSILMVDQNSRLLDDHDFSQYGMSLANAHELDHGPLHLDLELSTQELRTQSSESFLDEYNRTVRKFYLPFLSAPLQKYSLTSSLLSSLQSSSASNSFLQEKRRIQDLVARERSSSQSAVKALTPEQLDSVNSVWNGPASQKVVSAFTIDITARDLSTLRDGCWLNDNVIDFYLSLVTELNSEVFCWTTHFFTTLKSRGYQGVARWARRKKVNLLEKKKVIVPINIMSTHWALAVVDNEATTITYYDSLASSGNIGALEILSMYMSKEAERLQTSAPAYSLSPNVKTPQQLNGFDCGVFTCTTAKYVSRNKDLSFSQKDMKIIRRRMAYEIMHRSLLDLPTLHL